MDESTADRFWAKVARDRSDPTGCWTWTGALNENGYGVFYAGEADRRPVGTPRLAKAHRYAYEALFGPVPAGLDLDHLCRVRKCIRPDHLEPVTRQENLARGVDVGKAGPRALAARSACKRGHPFDEENTRTDARGTRICRACARERTAKYSARPRTSRNYRSDHCKNGHLFDEANTHVQANGERVCRACKRAATAAFRARQRGT